MVSESVIGVAVSGVRLLDKGKTKTNKKKKDWVNKNHTNQKKKDRKKKRNARKKNKKERKNKKKNNNNNNKKENKNRGGEKTYRANHRHPNVHGRSVEASDDDHHHHHHGEVSLPSRSTCEPAFKERKKNK